MILAAGLGSRIAALTNGGPKAMLEVHGRTLLERSIDSLERAGFREVFVVTGHAAERIRPVLEAAPDGMTLVERWNPEYATANNIVSLLTAAGDIGDGFCLLNCDITFDPSILVDVAGLGEGNWMVIDGDEPLGEEEMKVTVDRDGIIDRVNKGLDPTVSVGEYIGIMRMDAVGASGLLASARRLVDAGEDQLYYEDAVDRAAADLSVHPFWTRRRQWTEIDDEVDFQRALQVAADLDAQTWS